VADNVQLPADDAQFTADNAQLPVDSAAIYADGAHIPLARALDTTARRSIASACGALFLAQRF